MDLPKCKICGERHRLGPCAAPTVEKANPHAIVQPTVMWVAGPFQPEPDAKFDRVAYQREYMRKRRQRLKEK